MTDDLYRQEALDARSRTLYGDVILKSPPRFVVIIILLLAAFGLVTFMLLGLEVQTTHNESYKLLEWLRMGEAAREGTAS